MSNEKTCTDIIKPVYSNYLYSSCFYVTMPFTIKTYNAPIAALIEKYESGKITCIYGNAASGKTTTCLLACIAAAKEEKKVIYIDTENSFDSQRLKQLYFGDINEILDNIFIFAPKTFQEQDEIINKVKKLCEKESIGIVIIDTIGHHYRNILNENPKEINTIMAEQLAQIVRIARDLDKIVLMTNQVYSKIDGTNQVKMVGGKFVEKMSKIIIELNKDDDNRTSKLIKYKMEKDNITHYKLNKVVDFKIREKGLYLIKDL